MLITPGLADGEKLEAEDVVHDLTFPQALGRDAMKLSEHLWIAHMIRRRVAEYRRFFKDDGR